MYERGMKVFVVVCSAVCANGVALGGLHAAAVPRGSNHQELCAHQ